MPVIDADEIRVAREIPSPGLAAYRRFWRSLKHSADDQGIEIPPLMRNAIRNAWRDGYWTGRDAS